MAAHVGELIFSIMINRSFKVRQADVAVTLCNTPILLTTEVSSGLKSKVQYEADMYDGDTMQYPPLRN